MSNKHSSGVIAWFVHNPVAANLLVVLILVGGCIVGFNRPKQAFPPFPPKLITISVDYDSSSAESVEKGITIKLEEALHDINGIRRITSSSTRSNATVMVEKKTDYSLATLMRDIKSKVDAIATLPARAERPVISQEEWNDHIVYIHLFGDAQQETLQALADRVRRKLLAKPNINKVTYLGRRAKEISIEIQEGMLQATGLTLQDISQRIQNESVIDSGGELTTDVSTITLRADNQAYSEQDFRAIPLRTESDGSIIRLGDVATVREAFEEETILNRIQGKPAIGLLLVESGGNDTSAASADAQQVVDAVRQEHILPHNVSVTMWNDQSKFIDSRVSLLLSNGIMGMLLIIVVLALFLNLRLAVWVSFGVPVSIAGALLLMGKNAFNFSINELTSFGFIVALGILVDDAIVIGENIFTTRQEAQDPTEATITGASEVATPATFGVLTTVAAFLPLAFIKGEFGDIFGQFAVVVICCLLFSLLESKFILPSHLAQTSLKPSQAKITKPLRAAQQKLTSGLEKIKTDYYTPCMLRVLKAPGLTLLSFACLLLLLIALMFSGRIRTVFFPNITGSVITATFSMDQEAGKRLTIQNAINVEKALYAASTELQSTYNLLEPPVKIAQTDITGSADFYITAQLNLKEDSTVSTETLISTWQKKVGVLEGVDTANFNANTTSMKNIDIELIGTTPEALSMATIAVINKLKTYSGVYNVRDNVKSGQPELRLTIKPEARSLGITLRELVSQLQGGFHGYEAQRFQQGQDDVKVLVRYPAAERQFFEDLRRTRIRTASGALLPLEVVADITAGYAPLEINRANGGRVANIFASTNKNITSPAKVLENLEASFFPQLRAQYPDIKINLSGEALEEAEATGSLWHAFFITLLMIYALIAIPLQSYTKPLIIMSAIPFGFIGAIGGHMILGYPISMLSLFGVLALCGVVVNDSLLLVTEYTAQQKKGLTIDSALITAACKRMRSIILTSVTTFIGLVPLLLETSEQAQYLIPAAISMAYGILFATAITLLLVPALIRFSHNIHEAFSNWRCPVAKNTGNIIHE